MSLHEVPQPWPRSSWSILKKPIKCKQPHKAQLQQEFGMLDDDAQNSFPALRVRVRIVGRGCLGTGRVQEQSSCCIM